MKLTASCVALHRQLGRAAALTPGRVESSAFIPVPESASENRSQSEPERLQQGLGRLVLGAAGCWVGMTKNPPRGGGEPGIRVRTQCAAGSKGKRGRAKKGVPTLSQEPAGTS